MTDEDSLKIKKLELEIEELKNKIGWQQRLLTYLPILTIVLAIMGIWFNFHQFSESQKIQAHKDSKLRLYEFQKPYYQKTMDVYIDLINSSSAIATAEDVEEQNKAKTAFMQLFYGRAHFVGDEDFHDAKVSFFKCLDWQDPKCSEEKNRMDELKHRSENLAKIARSSLTRTWIEQPSEPIYK